MDFSVHGRECVWACTLHFICRGGSLQSGHEVRPSPLLVSLRLIDFAFVPLLPKPLLYR